MSIAFHGNYCGPGWSAGKYQASVVGTVPPVDDFDATCQNHDALYASGGDLASADLNFAFSNITTFNPKRWIAGGLVGAQGLLRYAGVLDRGRDGSTDKISSNNDSFITTTMPKTKLPKLASLTRKEAKNLRKVIADQELHKELMIKPNLKQKSRYLPSLQPSLSVATPPVSIGTTVRATKPQVRTAKNGAIITHREFLCQVYETSNSNFQLAAVAPLHPAYYVASAMGQLARCYQRYRFRKCAIHFVTRQPTSVTGEIALVYSSQITEPAENGASGNFLPRVMTRGDAILGPLW
jgi:hypothetical protein